MPTLCSHVNSSSYQLFFSIFYMGNPLNKHVFLQIWSMSVASPSMNGMYQCELVISPTTFFRVQKGTSKVMMSCSFLMEITPSRIELRVFFLLLFSTFSTHPALFANVHASVVDGDNDVLAYVHYNACMYYAASHQKKNLSERHYFSYLMLPRDCSSLYMHFFKRFFSYPTPYVLGTC